MSRHAHRHGERPRPHPRPHRPDQGRATDGPTGIPTGSSTGAPVPTATAHPATSPAVSPSLPPPGAPRIAAVAELERVSPVVPAVVPSVVPAAAPLPLERNGADVAAHRAIVQDPTAPRAELGEMPGPVRPLGCTPAQLRRFIKSRAFIPMHELRRRFAIDGADDDVTGVIVDDRRVYLGLPEREGRMLGDLLTGGEVGFELSLDPSTPIVIGVFPMRPIPRA